MIARMSKYNFVLFAAQSEDFVEKLRGLGLVDITTAGWEPSEETASCCWTSRALRRPRSS